MWKYLCVFVCQLSFHAYIWPSRWIYPIWPYFFNSGKSSVEVHMKKNFFSILINFSIRIDSTKSSHSFWLPSTFFDIFQFFIFPSPFLNFFKFFRLPLTFFDFLRLPSMSFDFFQLSNLFSNLLSEHLFIIQHVFCCEIKIKL